MKAIQSLTLSLLAAGCFSVSAQVQNTNFETWALTDTTWDGQPVYTADQWSGGTQTEDSYSGEFAAKVEPYMSCGIARNFMVYGTSGALISFGNEFPDFSWSGVPVQSKPVSLSGYFKFLSPDTSDIAMGIVVLKKFNPATGISEEAGRGEIEFSPSTGYAPFNIPIADLMPGVMPDSIVIAFSSGMGFNWENDASTYGTLYVDQLRLQAGNLIAGLEESTFACSFFPNPTQSTLHFTFESGIQDDFMLVISDMSGRKVITQRVVSGVKSTVDMQNLRAGTYIATIEGKARPYGQETILRID